METLLLSYVNTHKNDNSTTRLKVTWEPAIKLYFAKLFSVHLQQVWNLWTILINSIKQDIEVKVCFEQTDMEVSGNSAGENLNRESGTKTITPQTLKQFDCMFLFCI